VPRYDYQCVSCGHQFELVQSFSEAGTGTCPACSGNGRRLFHAVPVIYKGSGFYTTDYGRPKSPPPEKSDKSEKSEKKDKEPTKASKSAEGNGSSSSAADKKGDKSAAAPASTSSSESGS
jgi:putative FmdB family regulatory protein